MFTRPLILISVVALPASAGAHRLDEYLQAARVAIERDHVSVEIDLTPGVSIAQQVTAWIDTNHDGEISAAESTAYGHEVLQSLSLSVDQRAAALSLVGADAPTVEEMSEGVGTLRVSAFASIPSTATGRHELTLTNRHHPETSAYLANALVPSDRTIGIAEQRRAQDQHSLTIEYEIGRSRSLTRLSWVFSALALLAVTAWNRRLGHFAHRQTPPI